MSERRHSGGMHEYINPNIEMPQSNVKDLVQLTQRDQSGVHGLQTSMSEPQLVYTVRFTTASEK
jgi:hypothetical protein